MKQEDKLKTTLREYYDNQEVRYDASEWERASAYLAKERKGNTRKRLAFILIAILGISVTLFTILIPQTTETHLVTDISGHEAQSSPEEHQRVIAELPQPKIADSKNRNKIKSPEPKKNNLKNETSEFFNAPVESRMTDARQKQEIDSAKVSTPTIKVEKEIPRIENYPAPKVEPAEQIAEIETALIQKKDRGRVAVNSGFVAGTEEQPGVESEAKSSVMNSSNSTSVGSVNNKEEEETRQAGKQEEQLKGESQSSPVAEQKQTTADNDNVSAVKEENLQANTIAASSGVIADSGSSAEMAFVDTLLPSFAPLSQEGLYYELGAAGYYGWKTSATTDAQGVSPLLGINYMNRLGRKSSVSFGVQYLQVGNLSGTSKVSRISTYKYGEQSKVTVVTPTTLHYIVVPLRFHYFVDQKNAFGGGVNFAYLLNVVSKVTTYDEQPGVKKNYSTVKLSGYREGFSWYDTQVEIFYRRKFLNSFALQAEVFMGLTDTKQDAFFGVKAKEKNSGLKLSLIYFPFKKDKK